MKDIAVAANSANRLEEAFELALQKVCLFGGWSLGHVYWYDPSRPEELLPTSLWYPRTAEPFAAFRMVTEQLSVSKGQGLPGIVMERQQPFWATNPERELRPGRAEAAAQAGIRTAFGLPVLVGTQVAAVFEFFSPSVLEPDPAAIDLMAQVGTQLGRVIERKRAEEQIRHQSSRLEAQVELSRMLAEAETDIQKVLDTITVRVAELVGDTCTIALLSEVDHLLHAVAFYHTDPQAMAMLSRMTKIPQRLDSGTFQQVFATGQPVLVEDISQAEIRASMPPEYSPYLDHFGIHAMLIVPLRLRGQCIGTLAVSRDRPGETYSSADQEFLQELSDRAALAISNAQLFQALQQELGERKQIETELVELQRLMMDSVDVERLRLATRLHDEIIQGLYGSIFILEGLKESQASPDQRDQLSMVNTELQQVINRLQGTYKELRPPTLVPFGLDKAIVAYIDNFTVEYPELEIKLELAPGITLPERIGHTLFRIFLLALENVAKHARASEVCIRLEREAGHLVLEIQDNGRGFSIPEKWIDLVRQGRFGLARLSERAQSIGGRLHVESRPDQGTRVQIILPESVFA